MENKQVIEKLIEFQNQDKFSDEAWEERGLNPSDEVVCNRMNRIFNKTTQELIGKINSGAESNILHETLTANLNAIDHLDFDTEEREFICDLFFELAEITSLDISKDLNGWMYGMSEDLSSGMRAMAKKTLTQTCSGCGTILETFILDTDPSVPDHCWFIIQCNNCKTNSLLDLGPGVKQFVFDNYKQIEMLLKSEYNILQANDKLEQHNKS
jgi:hypothetical protein